MPRILLLSTLLTCACGKVCGSANTCLSPHVRRFFIYFCVNDYRTNLVDIVSAIYYNCVNVFYFFFFF
jgi:hypothetical protein